MAYRHRDIVMEGRHSLPFGALRLKVDETIPLDYSRAFSNYRIEMTPPHPLIMQETYWEGVISILNC
jgi:hypothetical protein